MISVIIITNNRHKEIIQVIEFLNMQTYDNFEVVIIDNGSKDNIKDKLTKVVIKKGIKYKLRYFHFYEKLGRSKARNYGADLADGDILLFIDDTVLLEKNVLSFVNEYLNKNKNILLFSHYDKYSFPDWFIEDKNIILNMFKAIKNLSNRKIEKNNVFQATMFFAILKSNFIKIGKFNEIFDKRYGFEDWEFSYRAKKMGFTIIQHNNIIYIHNFHNKDISDKVNSNGFYVNLGLFLLEHPELIYIEYLNDIKNPFYMMNKKEILNKIKNNKTNIQQLNKNYFFINQNGKMIVRYI